MYEKANVKDQIQRMQNPVDINAERAAFLRWQTNIMQRKKQQSMNIWAFFN